MAKGDRIALWMRQILASGKRGFIVGLSGGVDSAVVARLAQLAAPTSVLGVLLPCYSDPQDEIDAERVAAHFSLPTVRADLSEGYDTLVALAQQALGAVPDKMRDGRPADRTGGRLPLANIKPRLRMLTLYFLASSLNYLNAGTGNRSEIVVGFFTKFGDGGADLLPIGHLLKSEVRALAADLGVPQPIIERTPSAGLWLGQTDEEEMGFSYDDLERYLTDGPLGVSPALAMRIDRLMRGSDHKRALPPVPDGS